MARVAALDTRELGSVKKDEQGLFSLRRYPYRPYLQGGSVTIDPSGKRLFALDDDRGELVVLDASALTVLRRTKVCERPEQVAVGASGRAFVTCRGDGKVVSLSKTGEVRASVFLGGEPFGVALTPNGRSVLVTTVTKPRVVALSTTSLAELWTRDLPAEPRGVAIAADGSRATIAHLRSGTASVVDVRRGLTASAALPNLRDGWPSELFEDADVVTERRVAGGSFAVAASPGGTRAFVPYLLKNDGSKIEEFAPGCYANGTDLPIAASIAAIDFGSAQVLRPTPRPLMPGEDGGTADFFGVSQLGRLGLVRAAFHDPVKSRLFTVGEGSGVLTAFDTSKADPTSALIGAWEVGGPATGLVVDSDGSRAIVHRGVDDQLVVISLADGTQTEVALREHEPSLVEQGRRLFYTANDGKLAGFTGVSCSSCHLEGRSDGVTWRLDGKPLQTPSLAGRSFSADKLRWHGDSPNLEHAIGEAITRLGGSGLDTDATGALVAFIRSGSSVMERAARPASRARGQTVFADAGCASCHNPKTDYSDGQTHTFRKVSVRTPSLVGVGLSAPYYHDGSAPTLGALLRAHEENNPMAVGKSLGPDDLRDLERFLQSL